MSNNKDFLSEDELEQVTGGSGEYVGFECPNCHSRNIKTIDSRGQYMEDLLKCNNCGNIWVKKSFPE